jgi:putative transposase
MVLNDYGRIVENEWLKTGHMRPNIVLPQYIIMPNHIHGIIVIRDCMRWNTSFSGMGLFQK